MWADLDVEYRRLHDEGAASELDRKARRSAWALAIGLLLSLIVGVILGASPGARSYVQARLWDVHESVEATWAMSIRTIREYTSSPAASEMFNIRATLVAVAVLALTAVGSIRLFGRRP